MAPPLRICSTVETAPFQAAKWLSMQMMLDADEMEALFHFLQDFCIYRVGVVCKEGEEELSKQVFLQGYSAYVNALKQGILPDPSTYRSLFAAVMTTTSDALYGIRTGEDETIVRVANPVIQIQSHSMHYSEIDHKFRPMLFGLDTITWGIQFSYPQIYQDQQLQDIRRVDSGPDFPNTSLFRAIQQWQRDNTIPTPFRVEGGSKINIPMRLGKKCCGWINAHPQLKSNGLEVIV